MTLPAPARGTDLQVRITAPTAGRDLPVIVFAHGFGQSMTAADPLVDYWTAHGFVVVQPTFLDSVALGLQPADPRYPTIWRTRVDDLVQVIDELGTVIAAVPGLPGRVDTENLAAAGHSWGGQSVGMLLGARVLDSDGQPGEDRTDKRVKAGVLLSTTGIARGDLAPFAQENFAFMSPDFTRLDTPSIVVAGDHDQSALSTRGPDWFTDVYHLSPGARHLVTLHGGEHYLGGIQDYSSTATTDESPERVDLVRRTTTAFLRTALGIDEAAWSEMDATSAEPDGHIDSKQPTPSHTESRRAAS
ncbi:MULTISPECIES: alpha/beta hydrolase family protein [unclassified Rhodococcus (in: high G+C Gram-positive bacteria)]|uniref:alpha/beta hydrolase family protein n=1 Tax=unclassified Rhodococcus (in: high G+C Gram-positive bacteria) TaxID=192944 RepID=UPI001E550035|nr:MULTISPECIES: chlorophyllase [unclassified Rhodococcus (in: high G+C Gram-positive bacteria)]